MFEVMKSIYTHYTIIIKHLDACNTLKNIYLLTLKYIEYDTKILNFSLFLIKSILLKYIIVYIIKLCSLF